MTAKEDITFTILSEMRDSLAKILMDTYVLTYKEQLQSWTDLWFVYKKLTDLLTDLAIGKWDKTEYVNPEPTMPKEKIDFDAAYEH